MGAVEPHVTFRRLAQILGMRPIVHDAVMLVVSARIGGGPPDNRGVVVSHLELWRFGDLNVLSPLLRRRNLSDDWVGEEQDAGHGGDRQVQEQSIHRTDPQLLVPLGKPTGGVWGPRGPHTYVPALWDRRRGRERHICADIRRAGELSKTPSRGEGLITLGRRRNTGRGDHALTGKGI